MIPHFRIRTNLHSAMGKFVTRGVRKMGARPANGSEDHESIGPPLQTGIGQH